MWGFKLLFFLFYLQLIFSLTTLDGTANGRLKERILTDVQNKDNQTAQYFYRLKEFITDATLQLIVDANKNYSSNPPFPHTFHDNLFPVDVLHAITKEIPDDPQLKKKGCMVASTICFDDVHQRYKNGMWTEDLFGPATLATFRMLKSDVFIKFLMKLTGITDLIADPEYFGAGIHQTLSGGHLSVHTDFNRYEKFKMHRRVNVFLFLNPHWQDSYGGHLELWSRNLTSCGVKIAPIFNRFAVFSSTDYSYHGHPHPLTCPENRSRRSLAMYYYTKTRPNTECLYDDCDKMHSTIFYEPKCNTCDECPIKTLRNLYST